MRFVPRTLFLTRGVGIDKEKLTSFAMAANDPDRRIAAAVLR